MDKPKLNLLFYYYIHEKINEKFFNQQIVSCHEVANFIACKFRVPRQLKKKVILDLDSLGVVEFIRGDKLKIKPVQKVLPV